MLMLVTSTAGTSSVPNAYVYLTPSAAFWATMLASVPLTTRHAHASHAAVTFRLDTSTSDKGGQQPLGSTIGQAHVQSLLASASGAENRHPSI